MKILKDNNITDVQGFKAAGVCSGVKESGNNDLCIIYSQSPAVSAGTFTKNIVKAAPVVLSMENVKSENTQAVLINSGNANACTGEQGLLDAKTMTKATAEELGLSSKEVMICSTGIIGVPLPMSKITTGIKTACDSLSNTCGELPALAIQTTDSFVKKVTVEITIDNTPIKISGIAKGSGMIHPNMGTMLGIITTDANISKSILQTILKDSVEETYNMVSVDGDTSTNDTVIVLANGLAGNKEIKSFNKDYVAFKTALDFVNKELAILIAKDGEGATKLVEIKVVNGKTLVDAKLCAKSVISSSLFKAALFGNDANWGRVLCSLGYSTGEFSPKKVDVYFKNKKGSIQVAKDGMGTGFCKDTASDILDYDYVNVYIDLKDGIKSATAWGCDLSYDYVKINGAYSS